MPFFAKVRIFNLGQELFDEQLFVALTIGTGDFWFFPSWVRYPPEMDWMDKDFIGHTDEKICIVPEFIWPAGAGEFDGAKIYAVVLHQSELVSNVADTTFGWSE